MMIILSDPIGGLLTYLGTRAGLGPLCRNGAVHLLGMLGYSRLSKPRKVAAW